MFDQVKPAMPIDLGCGRNRMATGARSQSQRLERQPHTLSTLIKRLCMTAVKRHGEHGLIRRTRTLPTWLDSSNINLDYHDQQQSLWG